MLDKIVSGAKDYFSKPENLLRAIGIGGGGLLTGLQSRAAGRQAQQLQEQLAALGATPTSVGQQLVGMGQRGELTAAQQQALQTMRAQGQQQMARAGVRGGTAPIQMESAIQRQAALFAQQNIDQGMQLLNMGNQYTMAGIKAAYQADADARAAAQKMYMALAGLIPTSSQQSSQTVPPVR